MNAQAALARIANERIRELEAKLAAALKENAELRQYIATPPVFPY